MARKKQVTHRRLRLALEEHGGNITSVATALMVSRKTVYLALNKYTDLKDSVESIRLEFRRSLFELATNNLESALYNGEKWATLFALDKYDDLQSGGGGLGLSAEVLMLLAEMGADESEVVKAFEAMVREQARLAEAKVLVEGEE